MKKLMALAIGLVVCGMRAEEAQQKEKETLLYHMILSGKKCYYEQKVKTVQLKMYAKKEGPHDQDDAEKVLQDNIKAAESDLNLFRYDNINVHEEYNYFKEQRKKQIAERYTITTEAEEKKVKH